MFGMIIAGGRGNRLRPLTNETPKPLIKICGKPLILYQVEKFRDAGIDNIVLLLGYKWKSFVPYFPELTLIDSISRGRRSNVYMSVENAPLGRGGAIKEAMKSILPEDEDSFMVSNGDLYTEEDYSSVLRKYNHNLSYDKDHMATMLTCRMENFKGVVDLDGDIVTSFDENKDVSPWINAGLYVFNRQIFKHLPDVGDHETDTFPYLVDLRKISAYPTNKFTRSLDSFNDLEVIENKIKKMPSLNPLQKDIHTL